MEAHNVFVRHKKKKNTGVCMSVLYLFPTTNTRVPSK